MKEAKTPAPPPPTLLPDPEDPLKARSQKRIRAEKGRAASSVGTMLTGDGDKLG
jgi:hypothetical protein